jgi:aryl-alcohol dehydrogenase-like predicted oxidoreductase
MKTRLLGMERVAFSAIGYGCPPFQGRLAPDDEARAIRILERAIELGVTYIDAADHNKGNNEELLAPFLKGRRSKVLLSTKFGNRKGYPGEEARPADGRPVGRTGEGSASWGVGSRPSDAQARQCGASDHGGAERVFLDDARL